jgi:DNA modification methylase
MELAKWNYGDAYLRHPIGPDQIAVFEDESRLKVHNIFDPLPEFMKEADLIFVDPPWNLGNLNTFYTKAGRTDYQDSFVAFYKRLFDCIAEISPVICYVEVGKEYLSEFIQEMKSIYKHVTFYNSSYYHKKENICYVIRGSHKRKRLPLDYMDEEDIIAWICKNEDYQCIGDLCMGQGLAGFHAAKNGKRFVGTELNHKRLSVLLEKLANGGFNYTVQDF